MRGQLDDREKGGVTMSDILVCPNCGFQGDEKRITKGSFFIELILWLCFLIPGLIYSIWRLTTITWGCPSCGAPHMVQIDSPRGRKLLEEFKIQ